MFLHTGLFYSLSFLRVFLLLPGLSLLFSYDGLRAAPVVVQKNGTADTQWKQTPSGILVWGINSGGLEADIYNPQLQTTASCKQAVPGFTATEVELYYTGTSYYEFLLYSAARRETVFMRLDQQLKPLYISPKFLNNAKLPNDSVFAFSPKRRDEPLAVLRRDSLLWEIRKDTVTVSKGKTVVKSFLWICKEQKTDKFPVFKRIRRYEIDSRIPEYAKVFLQESNRLYFYMNYSFAQQEQFVYCITPADTHLVYKTKLAPNDSTGCIFSNHYFDTKTRRLFIATTCYSFMSFNGIAYSYPRNSIIVLNNNGTITTDLHSESTFFFFEPGFKQGSGSISSNRNGTTYNRFVSFAPDANGYLSSILETYALLYRSPETMKAMMTTDQRVDNSFHFFMVQKNDYRIAQAKPEHYNTSDINRSKPFKAGVRFGTIANYSSANRYNVKAYPDDINRLCDATGGDGYYVGRTRDDSLKLDRILMKNTMLVNADTVDIYLYKNVGNGTFMDFQDITAVPGQDLLVKRAFFIRDRTTLYRLTPRSDGYVLDVVKW